MKLNDIRTAEELDEGIFDPLKTFAAGAKNAWDASRKEQALLMKDVDMAAFKKTIDKEVSVIDKFARTQGESVANIVSGTIKQKFDIIAKEFAKIHPGKTLDPALLGNNLSHAMTVFINTFAATLSKEGAKLVNNMPASSRTVADKVDPLKTPDGVQFLKSIESMKTTNPVEYKKMITTYQEAHSRNVG